MPCEHKALLSSAPKWGDYCSYISPSVHLPSKNRPSLYVVPSYLSTFICEISHFIGSDCSIFAK